MHRIVRICSVAAFLILSGVVAVNRAGATPRARHSRCDPVVTFRPGESVGDSAVVQGHTVPRTIKGLKPYYPEPKGFFPFYPGERVVIVLDEHLLGLAVFDGCRLLTEFQPPPNFSWSAVQEM